MANPGYPQMGQMPPGMGPPMGGPPGMGGPPMGAMPPPRPMTRGTPKIVPVIVSAGLAVGVFCGLLFGVGTGKHDAAAAPSKGTNAKDQPVEDTTHLVVTPTKAITPTAQLGGSGAGSAQGSATGSGAGSAVVAAAGSGAGSAAGSAAVAPKTTKLTIKVKPEAAASVAKIQIDGKDIDGSTLDVPSDKKNVKIAVTATGYHSFEPKSYDLSGDEMTIEIELMKRGGGGSPGMGGTDTHAPKVPTRPPGPSDGGTKTPPKKKPGGLIDI